MNEAETRAKHIDPALKAAGWGVAEGSKILREYPITLGRIEGHGRRGKPLTADYVLVYRDRFAAVPFEDKGGSHPSRYYQDIAVERVMEAIAEDQPRILLTLATGTEEAMRVRSQQSTRLCQEVETKPYYHTQELSMTENNLRFLIRQK